MKKIIPAIIFLTLITSCASVTSMPEAMRPLSYRLISFDSGISSAAIKEYTGLNETEKKDAVSGIIALFGNEEDPYRRAKMLKVLDDMGAGSQAIIPLIKAAAGNRSIIDFREINTFLSQNKPAKEQIPVLIEMLKNGAWESRMLSMFSLSVLSKEAARAVPEIIAVMEEFGGDPGRYSKAFDSIAMINPEIAVAAVIDDINNPDSQIRKNAVLKLVELQAFLAAKLPAKKDIVPALIRALYSGDKALSELAAEGLSRIEDTDARQAAGSFLKMGRTAVNMLYKMAGTSAEEVFKKQEEENKKKLDDYFRSVGREDAVR